MVMIHSFTPHILLNIYYVPGTVLDANKSELPPAFPKLLGKDPGRPRWMGLWHTVSWQKHLAACPLWWWGRGGSMLQRAIGTCHPGSTMCERLCQHPPASDPSWNIPVVEQVAFINCCSRGRTHAWGDVGILAGECQRDWYRVWAVLGGWEGFGEACYQEGG